MKFDSNAAWVDAVSAVKANRQVLLPVAGVFFLLPTLLSTVFLTDVQTQVIEAAGKPEVIESIFLQNMGLLLGFGIGGAVVQAIGYLTVMALLSDRDRPTVGEAIVMALRATPTLIAATLLAILGMSVASFLVGLVIGGLLGLIAGPGIAAIVIAILIVVAMVYVWIKLSLVVPVVINEGIANPIAAMVRAWRLTRRNSLRLFGFYTLLTIGYVAIAFVATLVLVGPVTLLAGQGTAATLFTGVVSGAIGAVASVILVAVLAYTHRQLAGTSSTTIAQTFE